MVCIVESVKCIHCEACSLYSSGLASLTSSLIQLSYQIWSPNHAVGSWINVQNSLQTGSIQLQIECKSQEVVIFIQMIVVAVHVYHVVHRFTTGLPMSMKHLLDIHWWHLPWCGNHAVQELPPIHRYRCWDPTRNTDVCVHHGGLCLWQAALVTPQCVMSLHCQQCWCSHSAKTCMHGK